MSHHLSSRLPQRRRFLIVGLAVLIASSTLAIAATSPDLIPDSAFATLTVRDGVHRVADLKNAPLLKRYLDSDAYEALRTSPDFVKLQGGIYFFAGSVGVDPWALASQALGKELTIALISGDKPDKPHIVLILVPADLVAAERIVDAIVTMVGAKVDGKPIADRHRIVDGITGYKLNDEAYLAMFDGVVTFTNHAETLEGIIRKRADKAGKLASAAEYKQALDAAPAGACLVATANIRSIRKYAGEDWNKKQDNFIGAMFASGWVENIRRADTAVAWLEADSKSLSVGGRTFGGAPDDAILKEFVVAGDETKDWSKFNIPGLLGQIELSRNWQGFWELREKLLVPDGVRGAAEFAGIMTTIMGNLDFSGEFLASMKPTMRLIVARREFGETTPTPVLPSFALVFHMKDTEKLRPRLENGALMALSIINADASQKMNPQYQLAVENHAGVKMTVGKFPPNLDPGPPGIRYNFEPSIAVVGDRFVVATSQKMLEDFIDSFNRLPASTAKTPENAPDVLNTNLHELYRVFDANREAFITSRMIEKDLDRETAARDVRIFLDAAKLVSDLKLSMRPAKDGLTVNLRLMLAQ